MTGEDQQDIVPGSPIQISVAGSKKGKMNNQVH